MIAVGERYFVVIENDFEGRWYQGDFFYMKFPCTITYDELMTGDFISQVLIESGRHECLVFGEGGAWAKYAASEFIIPMDIIAFKPSFRDLFQVCFERFFEDKAVMDQYLSSDYKNRIINL